MSMVYHTLQETESAWISGALLKFQRDVRVLPYVCAKILRFSLNIWV